MIRLSDIAEGNPLIPRSEATRVAKMRLNEQRYNGEAGLVASDDSADSADSVIPINWFKRIALSFAEFVYGEHPVITIEGNQEFTDHITSNVASRLFRALFYANVDMQRFGTGVIVEPFSNGLDFQCCKGSDWFPLYDDIGERIIGDVVIRYVKRIFNEPGQAVVDIYHQTENYQERRIYQSNGGNFDRLLSRLDQMEMGMYRRAQTLTNGYPIDGYGESVYDEIAPFILELGKKLSELGTNISENSTPDFYGPEDAIEVNEQGEYDLSAARPRYMPVPSGGVPPGYLIYDSNADAIRYFLEQCEEKIFNFSGLTRSMYDPNTLAGNVTGQALRRLLLPFVSRIHLITELNTVAIRGALRAYNEELMMQGMPGYEWNDEDVMIDWGFEDILGDDEGNATGGTNA